MSGLVYTYALMKSLYDQGQDYLDAFWPFALRALPPAPAADAQAVRRGLARAFGLEIPLDVVKTILTRAKRKGYVRQDAGRYRLTPAGRDYVAQLETDTQVERRISALLGDIEQFFARRDMTLHGREVADLVLPFLQSNIAPLVEFLDPSAPVSSLAVHRPGAFERALVEYVEVVERERPDLYRTLQDMVLGSVISTILYARDPSELVEIGRRFGHCQVLLDTNFVLSLLELHRAELNEAAGELFRLLVKFGFRVTVFDFTVNEICRVIGRYAAEGHRYPSAIPVDTIYSNLARRGWTGTDARRFVINIESVLRRKGVMIDRRPEVNLRDYKPRDQTLRDRISAYKPFQGPYGQNHDLAAIEQVRDLRGKAVRRIEYAGACFLTSDVRLSRFNLVEMGHREDGTVSEVILDRLLTNMLWLKDPSTEPPLKAIIGAYSRDLFVNRSVWDRFYSVLRGLRDGDAVDDEQVSMLFYHNYIEDVLLGIDERHVDRITGEFVLQQIENASKVSALKIKEQLEQSFLARLTQEVSEAQAETDEAWLARVEALRDRVGAGARASARKMVLTARVLAALLVILPASLCVGTGRLDLLNTVGSAFSIGSLAASIVLGALPPIWNRLQTWLMNRLYASRAEALGLELLETQPAPPPQ